MARPLAQKHAPHKMIRDIAIVVLSVLIAILLVKTDTLGSLLRLDRESHALNSFISGIFFTSIFTTPVSMAALGEISLTASVWTVAFFGALGALLGDILIFIFIRDSLAEDIREILKAKRFKRVRHIFRFRVFRWLTPFLGAIVIATPLPDELGLAMMGLSKVRMNYFIPVSFIMNFIGILTIALIAHAIV